jgi:dTDP-4-amino-4,6-dideoxygalactose transaminase
MRVPLLDLSEQYNRLSGAIRENIEAVLASQRFILGPFGEQFERDICRYTGAAHAVGVSSGTDALLAVWMALELGPDDAVITTPFSFFATASCLARVGARPIFVDIDPVTYNMSPAKLEQFLRTRCRRDGDHVIESATGKRIRAILPVHLFGLCCDMDAIADLATEFHVLLVEDAAQAIGSEYPSRRGPQKAGTIGQYGCFSFYPSKNLGAAGDAGLVTCREQAAADQLRRYRQHGMEPRYFHHVIGGNFRLDEMQAAILEAKLPYLDGWSAARRGVADFYRQEFERIKLTSRVELPAEPYRNAGLTNHHIYHQFVIRTAQRDELRAQLSRREIGTEVYYPLGLHEQACFSYLGYNRGDFPETEKAARETLALPIYPELSREAQIYVVETIAEFFRGR